MDFQSNIQENKDWNIRRAETQSGKFCFQSNIQENKDWNFLKIDARGAFNHAFRATSKRTRIETRKGIRIS